MSNNRVTVTFYSNFLLLHQVPFCEEMVRILGDGFYFVATRPIPQDRIEMGYEDLSHSTSYSINAYENAESEKLAKRLAIESDIVIHGAAPEQYLYDRLKRNKITFRYSERFFKRGKIRLLDPRVAWFYYKNAFRYRNKNLYMLCASAYTAQDCQFIRCFPEKTFKWGYFPEVISYDTEELMKKKENDRISILWVGRQIVWKHPEVAVRLAYELKKKEYPFELVIIGDGPLQDSLVQQVKEKKVSDFVRFEKFLPQPKVREYMEKADIFLFTSDKQEGWGAVLNEAMNSGCAVVANDAIGSVPFLIKDGVNGLTYHNDEKDMIAKVEKLINDRELTKRMGLEAYSAMRTMWNAENATQRLVHLFQGLLQGKIVEFEEGPCSRA